MCDAHSVRRREMEDVGTIIYENGALSVLYKCPLCGNLADKPVPAAERDERLQKALEKTGVQLI